MQNPVNRTFSIAVIPEMPARFQHRPRGSHVRETSTHKYFSFQAITQDYFNHSVPTFIVLPAQNPMGGCWVAPGGVEMVGRPCPIAVGHLHRLLLPFERGGDPHSDMRGCLPWCSGECLVAAGAREVSAPHRVGFTAQAVGAKALHPALAITWGWTLVKAGFQIQ